MRIIPKTCEVEKSQLVGMDSESPAYPPRRRVRKSDALGKGFFILRRNSHL